MAMTPLRHLRSGKVRDLYDAGAEHLLLVASDRLSAYDVIMDDPVPDKGRVLTALSTFWFEQTSTVFPNHHVSSDPADFPAGTDPAVAGRAMLVRRATVVPLECVVRGYLFGSAWTDYRRTGCVQGTGLPTGLREADRLPEPIFTPTTKADAGHDEPLTRAEAEALVGAERFATLEAAALALYRFGAEHAAQRNVIIADTKLEFGEIDGRLVVVDEMLTPDSSRFWPADAWQPGTAPASYDKQFVRDWLDESGWDRTPPPPRLPAAVLAGTRERYVEAYERLSGRSFADWHRPPSTMAGPTA
jgi:phosphoribosylaminoimidazole-succinocarboxamide synthase